MPERRLKTLNDMAERLKAIQRELEIIAAELNDERERTIKEIEAKANKPDSSES